MTHRSPRLTARTLALAGTCVGIAALTTHTAAHADVIVKYSLPESGGTSTSSPVTAEHVDIDASGYTAAGGTQIGTTETHYLRVDSGDNGAKVATIDAAVANDMYGQFSVTVAPGQSLSLSTLDLALRNDRGLTGQTFSVYLRSSQNDFSTYVDLGSVSQTRTASDTETVQGPDAKSFDVSSLTNLVGTTIFRLYMVTDIVNNTTTSSKNIRIMPDVVLNGTVAPIPEPATLGLAVLGGLAMLGRRR